MMLLCGFSLLRICGKRGLEDMKLIYCEQQCARLQTDTMGLNRYQLRVEQPNPV